MSSPADLKAMAQRHSAVLSELTDILMSAARECAGDVAQAETPEEKKDAHKRLPALGRAVRLCLALEARLGHEALRALQAAERAERAGAQETAEAAQRARRAELQAKKALVQDRVERSIEHHTPYRHEDELDPHYEDLRTRLDDETFEVEFAHLPYEEVVRIVHRDLKLPEPQFNPQDTVRALIWAAQWGQAPEQASRQTSDLAAAAAETPEHPAPDPDPPPEPDFRYSSG